MPLVMPAPEEAILSRRDELLARLRAILPARSVIADETARRAYDCDAFTMYRALPLVVVLPETVDEVRAIMALAEKMNVKIVPRGAGTSLSGGAMPLEDGVLLGMAKFNRILEIDYENRCARVQPGVQNLAISKAVEAAGFYYAPDPSSQIACSIGGNVAENAGGVHCLKYGLTTNNILGLEIVLMGGDVVRLGGRHLDSEMYDLLGLMTGSEGLLGVVTEVTVRILRKPAVARGLLARLSERRGRRALRRRDHRAGRYSRRLGDDGQRHHPRGRAVSALRLSARRRQRLVIVELDGAQAEVDHLVAVVELIARDFGRDDDKGFEQRSRTAAILGRAQERLSGGELHRPGLSVYGRNHSARAAAGSARRHGRTRQGVAVCASPMCFTPAMAICIRSFSTTPPRRATSSARKNSAPTFCACALRWAACSPANMASASRSAISWARCSPRPISRSSSASNAPSIPAGRLNPGKVFPTLHRCAELGDDACLGRQDAVSRPAEVLIDARRDSGARH